MMNQVLNNNSRMDEVIPLEFHLGQNYPNPFKDKTVIKYCVAYKTKVRLTVFDEEGNEIEKLVDEEQKAGTYEVVFKSTVNSLQSATESYYYCLEAGDYSSEKKMILEK
jgi:trimeric autotransporter adhesin